MKDVAGLGFKNMHFWTIVWFIAILKKLLPFLLGQINQKYLKQDRFKTGFKIYVRTGLEIEFLFLWL